MTKLKTSYSTFTFLLMMFITQSSSFAFAQGIVKKTSYTFSAEDGSSLQTDIYFRDTVSKYPIILIRSPYPRMQYSSLAHFFGEQDYIVVVQSVRGTGGSGGRMIPFVNEEADGRAMLDQLTAKNWCNGSIGIYGTSYSSFCAMTLGASGHPSLKAIININGWVEPSLIATPAGVNHIMMNIPWMLFNFSSGKLVPGKYNADSLFRFLPVDNVLKQYGIGFTFSQLQGAMSSVNKNFSYKNFNVPVMHVTGMYDFTKEGTMNVYDSLRKYNKTQRILIGPWIHDQVFSGETQLGERKLPKSIADSSGKKVLDLAADWFKRYLKNEPLTGRMVGVVAMPVFTDSYSLQAYEYPASKIKTVNFYLHMNQGKEGTLKRKQVEEEYSKSFNSDLNNPVPTAGGANFHFFKNNTGPRRQDKLGHRPDVLYYTTEKLASNFNGLGKAKVKLFVSHHSVDCDFTAKLVAIDREENGWIIGDGITRMSNTQKRNTGAKDEDGNAIFEIEIDLGHIAFELQPGWRIRVDIAGSNFPKYERNPGTGESPLLATTFNVVKQTIHHGKQFPCLLSIDEMN